MQTRESNLSAVLPAASSSGTSDRGTGAVNRTIVEPTTLAARPGGEERRRSQRVLLRIRAEVHIKMKGKTESVGVYTLSVNPFGAMLVSPSNLPVESRLVLEHSLTRERVACHVVRSAVEMPEGFHVPVEFDVPSPGFWKIDFPPEDWKIHAQL